ncbi:MAG: hypothetical protein J3Q66DRAFT_344913 [Benniella sp.]|nr:MAG: hypothetical protein J3Q66DRAFT_344913 [Benniella sp.]
MPPQPAPGDCRFCGRHFKFLREHEKNMHDGDAGRMERVPCTFPYCTSRFLNKAALRKHFEKHHRFAKSPSPPPAPLIPLPLLPQYNAQQDPQVAKEETQSQQELQNPSVTRQQDQQPERQDRDEPKQEPKHETQQEQDDPSTEQQQHNSMTLQHTEPKQPPTDPKLEQTSQEELSKRSESTQGQAEDQQEPPPPPSVDSSGTASSLKAGNSEQAIPNGQEGAEASSPKAL